MKKLVGRINVESSGDTILVEFYNSDVNVVSTSFDVNTKEILVTIDQPILDSNIVTRRMLANEINRLLHIVAVNQTQFSISIQDFDGLAIDNITYSYFDIDILDNSNAFFTNDEQLILDEIIKKLQETGLSEKVMIGIPMPLRPR